MAKPRLTSLSALMPKKGEATQPEVFVSYASKRASDHAGEHVSEQASSRAIEQASILSAEETSDNRVADTDAVERQPAPLAMEKASKQESIPVREQAREQADPDGSAEFQDGPRSAVSFRMTERLQDRLREYAHKSRRKKQDVLDQAVHEFLRREGF